ERVLALERGAADCAASPGRLDGSSGAGGVRRLIAQLARVPAASLAEGTRLAEGLGLASLDLVELAASFRDEYGLRLAEDRLGDATVGDLERLVQSAAGDGRGADAPPPAPADAAAAQRVAAPTPHGAGPAAAAGGVMRGGLTMPRWTRSPPARLARRCVEELVLVPFVRHYARPEVIGRENLNGA